MLMITYHCPHLAVLIRVIFTIYLYRATGHNVVSQVLYLLQ